MRITYILTLISIFSDDDSSDEDNSSVEMEHVPKKKSRSFPVLSSSSNDAVTPDEGSSNFPVNLVEQIAETVIKKLASSKKVGMSPEIIHEDFDDLASLPYPMKKPEEFDFESMDPRFYMIKFPSFMEYLDHFNCTTALEKVFTLL